MGKYHIKSKLFPGGVKVIISNLNFLKKDWIFSFWYDFFDDHPLKIKQLCFPPPKFPKIKSSDLGRYFYSSSPLSMTRTSWTPFCYLVPRYGSIRPQPKLQCRQGYGLQIIWLVANVKEFFRYASCAEVWPLTLSMLSFTPTTTPENIELGLNNGQKKKIHSSMKDFSLCNRSVWH